MKTDWLRAVYFVEKPDEPVWMYPVDAASAVGRFPDQWSYDPWPTSPASASTKSTGAVNS